MNQEFVYGKFTKCAGYVFGSLSMAGGIYFFNSALTRDNQSGFQIAIGALISLMGVYCILNVYRKKVTITHDAIIYRGSFKTTSLYLNDIKGFEKVKNTLIIKSDTGRSTILIGDYVYLTDYHKILAVIKRHGVNLDHKQYEDELTEILDDPEIGYDQNQRQETLKKAKRASSYLNYIGGAIGLWAMLYPHSYNIAITTALLFPLIALAIFSKFKNVITLVENKNGAKPSISLGLMIPSVGVFIRALIDYDLLNYKESILPTAILLAITCFVFYLVLPKTGKASSKLDWLWMSLLAMPYCYGAAIQFNCLFDNSLPVNFNTTVESKNISESKGKKHYKLTLTAWERGQQSKEIEVTQTEYEQTPVDGPVGGHIKSGYLHIRWFYLDM